MPRSNAHFSTALSILLSFQQVGLQPSKMMLHAYCTLTTTTVRSLRRRAIVNLQPIAAGSQLRALRAAADLSCRLRKLDLTREAKQRRRSPKLLPCTFPLCSQRWAAPAPQKYIKHARQHINGGHSVEAGDVARGQAPCRQSCKACPAL